MEIRCISSRFQVNLVLSVLVTSFVLIFAAQAEQVTNTRYPPTTNEFLQTLSDSERSWLREHPVISLAHDPDWPPVEFTDERGEISGMSGDYLNLVEQRLGVKFKRLPDLTWQETYARQKRWEIDMATCVAVTPERTEFWAFTKPYMTIPIVIATQLNVPYIADMKELFGKKVAVVKGYAIDGYITQDLPEINLVRINTVLEGLELLQHGEVFAYIDNLLIIGNYQAKMKVTSIKIAGQTPYVNAQCMAVRKDWAPLAGILQKALESISEKERNDIYRKWLPVRYEHGFNYTLLWQSLAVFGVISLALLLWNRKLAREITFRKQAEADLLAERQYLIDVIDSLPDATFIIDIDQRIAVWNKAAEAMTNVKREELLGKGDYAYSVPFYGERRPILIDLLNISEKERERSYTNVKRVDEKIYAETFIQTLNDGKGAYLWGVAAPLYDRSGSRIGAIEVIKDISELKKAEKNNIHLQEQLLQAQKIESIGRLAGGVAHDFNNMLGVILGHTELAQNLLDPDQPLFHNLEEIRKAARRSADITRQLLAFARKQTIAPRVIDLNKTVDGMLTMLRRLIGEDINLSWLPGKNVAQVNMDPSQLDQILANLFVNARDAIADTGNVAITTDTATFDEAYCKAHPGFIAGDYVLLQVSDDGCGMDPETKTHLFEPFFTTKEIGKGTGLGLATIHGIVKQNNGFINVDSEPGQGATFHIYLPRHAAKAEPRSKGVEASLSAGGSESILLVEDEPMILDMTTAILKLQGYKVLPAATPREAIRLAEEHDVKIDLLITDVVMPEMNGRDLAGKLLSLHPNLKRLFMSGYTADVIAHHGVLDEGVHFIQKPFSINGFAAKVREVLDEDSSSSGTSLTLA